MHTDTFSSCIDVSVSKLANKAKCQRAHGLNSTLSQRHTRSLSCCHYFSSFFVENERRNNDIVSITFDVTDRSRCIHSHITTATIDKNMHTRSHTHTDRERMRKRDSGIKCAGLALTHIEKGFPRKWVAIRQNKFTSCSSFFIRFLHAVMMMMVLVLMLMLLSFSSYHHWFGVPLHSHWIGGKWNIFCMEVQERT